MYVTAVIENTTNTASSVLYQLSLHEFKSYHLPMCNRILLWLGKLPRWSRRHVSRGTFQSGLRFQTSLSSLRVSCKRTLGVSEYWEDINLANICLFIVKNWIARKKCEIICPKLIINTSERCQWRHSGFSTIIFWPIWHVSLVCLLLAWSR